MKKTIDYDPAKSNYRGVVLIDKITHLSKSDDGEVTYIHLVTGEKLESTDSMNTLQARINLFDEQGGK